MALAAVALGAGVAADGGGRPDDGATRPEGGLAVLVLGLCSLDDGGDLLAWFTFSREPLEPNDWKR